jgi:hypothetical protein
MSAPALNGTTVQFTVAEVIAGLGEITNTSPVFRFVERPPQNPNNPPGVQDVVGFLTTLENSGDEIKFTGTLGPATDFWFALKLNTQSVNPPFIPPASFDGVVASSPGVASGLFIAGIMVDGNGPRAIITGFAQ